MSSDTATVQRRESTPTSGAGSSSTGGASTGTTGGAPLRRELRSMTFDQADSRLSTEPGAPVQMRVGDGGPVGDAGAAQTDVGGGGGGGGTTAGPVGPAQATGTGTGGGQTATAGPQQSGGTGGTTTAGPQQSGGTGGQTAAVGPAADGSNGPQAAVGGGPRPAPYQDPTRDPEFRRRTLAWAQGSIERIRELMSYGVFDWAITNAEATTALTMLEGMPTPNRVVVVEQLRTTNAADRLLTNTPEGAKQANKKAYITLAAALNHPELVDDFFGQIPSFISAGVDAPMMQRAMSIIGQDQIRQAAVGIRDPATIQQHPFSQWISKTPDPPQSDLMRRFTEEANHGAQAAHAADERVAHEQTVTDESARLTREDPNFRAQIQSIQGLLSYGVFDWAITDREARQVFAILSGLPPAQQEPAVVQLDQHGFMDRFLDNLPEAERWGAQKATFLRLIRMRTAERNVRFVQQMLTHVFDFLVTSEEAHLAWAIIQTLPRDLQDQFRMARNGEWWNLMTGNLDQRQANDRDANTYSNVEQTQQRKIDFTANCATWDRGQLTTNLEMLCRMHEDAFVETELRRLGVIASNPWITETYGFGPDRRDDAVYTAWIENRAGDRQDVGGLARAGGFFQTAGTVLSGAGQMVGTLGNSASVSVNLEGAQNMMNGSLSGGGDHMVLAHRENEEDNRLDIALNRNQGTFSVRGRQLNIASYSGVSGERTIQTGPIAVAGIEVDAKWPTETDRSSRFRISIPGIMARDIAIMQRDSMSTVGEATIRGLVIEAQAPPGVVPPSEGEAATFLMSEVERATKHLMSSLQGVNSQPDQVSAAMTNAFTNMTATVRIGSIAASRIGASDGSYIEHAEVTGVGITVQNNRKGDTVRARLGELTRLASERALTHEETTQQTDLERQLPQIVSLEQEESRLADMERSHHISMADQDRLGQIRAQLTVTNATVQVDSLAVHNAQGLAGTNAGDLTMTNLHASVTGETSAGDDHQSTAHVDAHVDGITGRDIVMRGTNRLEATEGRVTELRAKIREGRATSEERAQEATLGAQVTHIHELIRERDAMRLAPAPDAERMAALTTELQPWEGRQAETRVGAMALTNVDVHANAGASGANAAVTVDSAFMVGVDSGGRHIDSIDAQNVALGGQVTGDARGGADERPMMERLASGHFDAGRLEMAGYHAAGQSLSETLTTEQRTLQQTLELHPEQVSPAQQARLQQLPDLLTQARAAETRLAALRAKEHEAAGLTREERAEMQVLAGRCDPHTMTINRVEAHDVHATATQEGGIDLSVGHAGSGQAGLTMEGFSQGTVGPDGQEQTTRSIDRMSAESMNVHAGASGGLAGLADSANLGSNGSQLQAGVSGTGLDIHGFTQGQAGQSGYQHVEDIHANGFAAGYDRQAGGGTAAIDLQGASASGITRQSSRLESLDQAIAQYTAQESSGVPCTPEQTAHVAELRRQRHAYEDLQARLARARTAAARRPIQAQITEWERNVEQRIASVSTTHTNAQITNVGNVMSDNYNYADQNMGVRAHVDQLDVGRVSQSDSRGRQQDQLTSAHATDINVTGQNILGANGQGSTMHAGVGSFDARGVHAGGASVRRARGTGLEADINTTVDPRTSDRHMGVNGTLQSGNVSGVNASGASVGSASVSRANFGVTNAGERNQHASLGAGSVSASGVHYAGGGTTASVASVHGSGLGLSMGGGNISGGLRSASGSGVSVHQAGADGATTDASVATFQGRGIGFANGGGGMHANARSLSGTGVDYRGVAGASMAQDNATVANPDAGTVTTAHVDAFDVTGARYSQTPGPNGVMTAGVDRAQVTGVSGSQDLVHNQASVGRREGGATSATVENAGVTMGPGGQYSADVGRANVAGGHFTETNADGSVRSGSTGPQGVTVNGLHVDGNRTTGDVTAQWRTITGDQLTFTDNTDPTQRRDVVLNQLQIGSADQVSIVHWDGTRIAGAQISQVLVGANSHAYLGPNADQHHDQSYAVPRGDQTTRIEMQGGISMSNIRVQNLNPSDLTELGTTVRIGSAGATNFVYSGNGNTLVVDHATATNLFAAGQGNRQMMAGVGSADGSMHMTGTTNVLDPRTHQATGETRQEEVFGGTNMHVQNAYAVLEHSQGGDWDLVRAHVDEVSGDQLHVRVTPTGADPNAVAGAAPPHQAMDMSALSHMNGSVGVDVDVAGLLAGHPDMASIAARFPHLNLDIPIHDGNFTIADMTIALNHHGISGRTAAILAGYLAGSLSGVPGGSLVGAAAAGIGAGHPISAQGVAEWGASRSANGAPSTGPSPYLNGINLQIHMQDLGGRIQYGTAFQGDVAQGGQVDVGGNVGRDMNIHANMDINNAQVGNTTSIGQIHTGDARVQITDVATGQSTIDVNVAGGRVQGIDYNPAGHPGQVASDRDAFNAAQTAPGQLPEQDPARRQAAVVH